MKMSPRNMALKKDLSNNICELASVYFAEWKNEPLIFGMGGTHQFNCINETWKLLLDKPNDRIDVTFDYEYRDVDYLKALEQRLEKYVNR